MRSSEDSAVNFQLEVGIALDLFETLDTPVSLACHILANNHEWHQLLSKKIDPADYQHADDFRRDVLAVKVLSKSQTIDLKLDLEQEALDSFRKSQEKCMLKGLSFFDGGPTWQRVGRRRFADPFPPWAMRAKRILSSILGPCDERAMERIVQSSKPGPGACIGVPGIGSVASDKYDACPTITEELLPFYRAIVGEWLFDKWPQPIVVKGGTFFTVTKDAKARRGASTEPAVNGRFQKGIGAYFMDRLLRFGIDLHTQAWNQTLAEWAMNWGLATLDLSKASDSQSCGMVFRLLPERWLHLLTLARSAYVKMPDTGEYEELHVFSTMGNGFTFPLMTAIIWAVITSIVDDTDHAVCAVYGDDIVVPQSSAQAVIDALEFLGFSVNTSKSYLAGCFFESCGTDWFNGEQVRPFYLRQDPQKWAVVPPLVHAANSLRLWAKGVDGDCDDRYRELWKSLSRRIVGAWGRCRVPENLRGSGLVVAMSEIRTLRAHVSHEASGEPDGWEGYDMHYVEATSQYVDKESDGVVQSALSGAARSHNYGPVYEDKRPPPSLGREPVRGLVGKERLSVAVVQPWHTLNWVCRTTRTGK